MDRHEVQKIIELVLDRALQRIRAKYIGQPVTEKSKNHIVGEIRSLMRGTVEHLRRQGDIPNRPIDVQVRYSGVSDVSVHVQFSKWFEDWVMGR